MNEKVFGMIGMAKRAGKLAVGETAVKQAVRAGRAELVIMAEDASDNAKKSVKNSCGFYKVQYVEALTKSELGHCAGTAPASAAAVNDYNFAKAVSEKINHEQNDRKG